MNILLVILKLLKYIYIYKIVICYILCMWIITMITISTKSEPCIFISYPTTQHLNIMKQY